MAFNHEKYTLAVNSFVISCKLDELDQIIKSVEEQKDFYQWIAPPLEQLDKAIGKLVDPNSDEISPTMMFYMLKIKIEEASVKYNIWADNGE